jgi:hypothetical protein
MQITQIEKSRATVPLTEVEVVTAHFTLLNMTHTIQDNF